jgi:hypothetical protein
VADAPRTDDNKENTAMKSILAFLLAFGLPCTSLGLSLGTPADWPEYTEVGQLKWGTIGYYQNLMVDKIDQQILTLYKSGERQIDGRWKADTVVEGVRSFCNGSVDFDRVFERLNLNKEAFKDSPTLALLEGECWNRYGWSARGSGYASSVNDVGWRLFRERVLKHTEVIEASRTFMEDIPAWHEDRIRNLGVNGSDRKRLDDAMRESTARFRFHYPTYIAYMNFQQPKWGGSWDEVEKFARYAVKNTQDVEGLSLYARLYWYVSQGMCCENDLFSESKVVWPDMKRGFEDLMKRYPNSKRNLNAYASFACQARDKATYLAVRKQFVYIAKNEWKQNNSAEVCDEMFGYVPAVQ